MAAQKKYLDELRERAVKMVFEIRERDGKGHGELARVLAATMAGLITQTAFVALGSSGAPFHADGRHWTMAITERSDRNPPLCTAT